MLSVALRGHRRGVWAAQFSPVDQVAYLLVGSLCACLDNLMHLCS